MQLTNRTAPPYDEGVQEFLDFAFNSFEKVKLLCCLCRKCINDLFLWSKSYVLTLGDKWDKKGLCYMESSWRSD